jgi:hypothetical protein
MSHGFTHSEAYHMSVADARRYMAVIRAWSIPDDRRVVTRMATTASEPLA